MDEKIEHHRGGFKMKKEFNLSEKIKEVRESDGTHNITDIEEIEKDVREFIIKLRGRFNYDDAYFGSDFRDYIDKLAGDYLN